MLSLIRTNFEHVITYIMSVVNCQGAAVMLSIPQHPFAQGRSVSNHEVPLESNSCSWHGIDELAEGQNDSKFVVTAHYLQRVLFIYLAGCSTFPYLPAPI